MKRKQLKEYLSITYITIFHGYFQLTARVDASLKYPNITSKVNKFGVFAIYSCRIMSSGFMYNVHLEPLKSIRKLEWHKTHTFIFTYAQNSHEFLTTRHCIYKYAIERHQHNRSEIHDCIQCDEYFIEQSESQSEATLVVVPFCYTYILKRRKSNVRALDGQHNQGLVKPHSRVAIWKQFSHSIIVAVAVSKN